MVLRGFSLRNLRKQNKTIKYICEYIERGNHSHARCSDMPMFVAVNLHALFSPIGNMKKDDRKIE